MQRRGERETPKERDRERSVGKERHKDGGRETENRDTESHKHGVRGRNRKRQRDTHRDAKTCEENEDKEAETPPEARTKQMALSTFSLPAHPVPSHEV